RGARRHHPLRRPDPPPRTGRLLPPRALDSLAGKDGRHRPSAPPIALARPGAAARRRRRRRLANGAPTRRDARHRRGLRPGAHHLLLLADASARAAAEEPRAALRHAGGELRPLRAPLRDAVVRNAVRDDVLGVAGGVSGVSGAGGLADFPRRDLIWSAATRRRTPNGT